MTGDLEAARRYLSKAIVPSASISSRDALLAAFALLEAYHGEPPEADSSPDDQAEASNVDAMEAGPELDVLVAERVFGGAGRCGFRCPRCSGSHFGCHKDKSGKWIRGCHGQFGHCGWKGSSEESLPQFSKDDEEALVVVKKLRGSGSWCCIAIESDYDHLWTVKMTPHGSSSHKPTVVVEDESLALAICRAAVMAVKEAT